MSYDGAYPEDSDPDDDYWDDDPWDGIEPEPPEPPEPNCLGPGCYDSGTDWRGRRCRMCNPTPWQARRAEWTWSAAAPWRWVRRKVRARMRPSDVEQFPPF